MEKNSKTDNSNAADSKTSQSSCVPDGGFINCPVGSETSSFPKIKPDNKAFSAFLRLNRKNYEFKLRKNIKLIMSAEEKKKKLLQAEALESANSGEQLLVQKAAHKKLKCTCSCAIGICITNCRYSIVPRVAKQLGWKISKDSHLWSILWTDTIQGIEMYKNLKRFQKINHFPGMGEICRKDLLARNLNRMLKMFPADYNIFPKTWCFPADFGEAVAYSKEQRNKTFILKPDQGAQGRGIRLVKSLKEFKPNEHLICQVYISKPLLIDGYKFDLRVYTLITSVDPLRVFVYNEGLARFATTKYKDPTYKNTSNIYMHLTNYSVNKHSTTYSKDLEVGSKRTFSSLNKRLFEEGCDVQKLWKSIDDIIIKTFISAWPVLKHNYHACFPSHDVMQGCFEILGFDILIDHKMKPYILEVNHSPSFHTEGDIDVEVKEALIKDAFNLLSINMIDKRKIINEDKKRVKRRLLAKLTALQRRTDPDDKDPNYARNFLEKQFGWEDFHLGGYRRIMPVPNDPNKYREFFLIPNQASVFSETAASKYREDAAKALREALVAKKAAPRVQIKTKSARPKRQKEKVKVIRKWSEGNLIPELEERKRLQILLQRDILVKQSGILQLIYESFDRCHLLSETDRRKYKTLLQTNKTNISGHQSVKDMLIDSVFSTAHAVETHN